MARRRRGVLAHRAGELHQVIGSWWARHGERTAPWLVLLAALVSSGTGIGNGFALDDVLLIETDPLVHSLSDPWKLLTSAYWRLPPSDTLWRPLGTFGYALQWAAGGGAPWVFHLTSIVLYALVCALAYGVARRLLPRGPAVVAAIVFAVHPVHVESVGNIVGQLELGVAVGILASLLLYLRNRQTGVLRARTVVAICALQLVALGFKEHAVLLPLFLLAAELTVLKGVPVDGGPRTPGFARARILYVALFALVITWMLVRSDVIGGDFAGDWPHRAIRGLGVGERAWVMLALVPEVVRLMLWPARLYVDYSPQLVPVLPSPSTAHIAGALCLIAYAAALVWTWRRDRLLAFGLLWFPVALSLVANIAVPTGILLAERTLFLASFGVALLVGGLARIAWPHVVSGPRTTRLFVAFGGSALIIIAAAHSSERQFVWKDNGTIIAALVADAPTSFRGYLWLGDSLFRANLPYEGEQAMTRARDLWPDHDAPLLMLAIQYQNRGRCDAAMPLFERVIELEPIKPAAHFGYAACLFTMGRYTDARRASVAATSKVDRSHRAFNILIMRSDSVLSATDTVRPNNRWLLHFPTGRR
jgi:hypothetical protein